MGGGPGKTGEIGSGKRMPGSRNSSASMRGEEIVGSGDSPPAESLMAVHLLSLQMT